MKIPEWLNECSYVRAHISTEFQLIRVRSFVCLHDDRGFRAATTLQNSRADDPVTIQHPLVTRRNASCELRVSCRFLAWFSREQLLCKYCNFHPFRAWKKIIAVIRRCCVAAMQISPNSCSLSRWKFHNANVVLLLRIFD